MKLQLKEKGLQFNLKSLQGKVKSATVFRFSYGSLIDFYGHSCLHISHLKLQNTNLISILFQID